MMGPRTQAPATGRLRIVPVEAAPLNLQIQCKWIWDEWGHGLYPTYEHLLAEWRAAMGKPTLPQLLSALWQGECVGTVGLSQYDFAGRPDLAPWLVALYVPEAWRGRGIASALVRACEAEAARRHVETLYLATEDAGALYRKLGWDLLSRDLQDGEPLEIYCRDIRSCYPRCFG